MEQLFYAPEIASTAELPEDESVHCTRVLRLKKGDLITVTDGKGFFYEVNIVDIHPKHCRVTIVRQWPQKPHEDYKVHIAVAPTKNKDRMEWLVEKLTEIGIDAITFLDCKRSERKEIKPDRLVKTAISAMKQSQKAFLPQINEMMDFNTFIALEHNALKMIAFCDDGYKQLIKDVYPRHQNALILIGPEGDFSPEEVKAALSNGFTPVSLGESRLRTETAAMVACLTIHLLNQ